MRHQRYTGRQQFGAGSLNPDFFAVFAVEANTVVGAVAFLIFKLGLCYGGSEGDVPHSRRLRHVGVACLKIFEECKLRDFA